jgi:hypothetical protein
MRAAPRAAHGDWERPEPDERTSTAVPSLTQIARANHDRVLAIRAARAQELLAAGRLHAAMRPADPDTKPAL